MKYDMDELMKQTFTADREPDGEAMQEVLSRFEKREKTATPLKWHLHYTFPVTKVAVALFMMFCLTGIGAMAYSGIKGIPLHQIFVTPWGKVVKMDDATKYESKIVGWDEKYTIDHLTVSPEHIYTDGYLTYMIFKIKADDTIRLTEGHSFRDVAMYIKPKGEDSSSILRSCQVLETDAKDNAIYMALSSVGDDINENTMVDVHLYFVDLLNDQDRTVKKGVFEAVMKTKVGRFASVEVKDKRLGDEGLIKVTPMGMKFVLPEVSTADNKLAEKLLCLLNESDDDDVRVFAVMADGEKIALFSLGGALHTYRAHGAHAEAQAQLVFHKPAALDQIQKILIDEIEIKIP